MSWDEIQTRLRQELSKRLDVAQCKVGLQPGRNGLRSSPPDGGSFFFSTQEVQSRVALLRKHLPEQAREIVKEADAICGHRFRLLGYRDVSYGPEIDWQLDAVHGRRSPLTPWYKINFLNFDEVGDHKVTWELNRHQHLITLAKAWSLTGKDAYAKEILAQWQSWQSANPYPLGANWASSLEVAFRSLSWIWLDRLLAGYRGLPKDFQNELARGLALNGRHIERYLSTYFSPNTHLLGEAVALFFIGTLYPQIPDAEKWKRKGWRIIQEEAVRQVRPDGIYFEQTLYYHVYALDFFLHARLLALRNGMKIPADFDLVLRKMLSFVEAVSQTGPPDDFGDDDGGRVFDSSRNLAEYMTDPLPIGAALYDDDAIRSGGAVTEEAIWLLGAQAIPFSKPRPNTPGGLKPQSFPDGGIYIIGSAEPFSQQMIIDAGPQGTGRCGHGHADALSLRLSFSGRRWLVDAGTCWYIGPGDERSTFRGTRAHNTLTVDGLDQAQSDGPFAWNLIPRTEVERNISGPSFTLFAGSHSGYERLPEPVRHRRFVFHLDGSFWLIRDVAEGRGSHLLETSWHFAPDLEISQQGETFVARPARGQPEPTYPASQLTILPIEDQRWTPEVHSEYVSPAYGQKVGAPVLRFAGKLALPAEHAVVLIAATGKEGGEDAGRLSRDDHRHDGSGAPEAVYRFVRNRTTHCMIFGRSQKAWSFGPWASDARILYFRLQGRRIEQALFCEGSSVQLLGESLIKQEAPVQWLEWTNRDGHHRVASSDEAAARSFLPSILDSEIEI
jgi:hypothetical protein